MNDIENDKIKKSEITENQEEEKKKSKKGVRKTQAQIIQEALGLKPNELQDVEKKLFIVRFLDYFSEDSLEFIFNDKTLDQYIKQITSHFKNSKTKGEEDRLLTRSFESKKIIDTIYKLKSKAEEIAISKGLTTSVHKRLRNIAFYSIIPMLAFLVVTSFFPVITYLSIPILCLSCMIPQLLRGRIMKKWFDFKEQNKNQFYTEKRADIMVLKNFTGETLDHIRTRLLELKVPLQLIKFILFSRDYDNLRIINQKNIRGSMQYFYTFDYPEGVEPYQIPQELMQFQASSIIPEKEKDEKPEKNFVVLTEMKGRNGIINSFIPTLKDNLAEKINEMLNNSEFSKAPNKFENIIPNYSENIGIYCICGEVAEINIVQICNWKDEFKFYLFETEPCKCGETVYALSLMDETVEIPEELKDIFLS